MKVKKAKRHYEAWSLEEAKGFIDHYLENVKLRDVRVVIDQYAKKVERTFDAVSFRQKEIISILTNGEQGLQTDKWTSEFIEAVDDKLKEGTISKAKLIMLFE